MSDEREPIDIGTCRDCVYFYRLHRLVRDEGFIPGECRRRAPESPRRPGDQRWPRIDADDWCGDFVRRADAYRWQPGATTEAIDERVYVAELIEEAERFSAERIAPDLGGEAPQTCPTRAGDGSDEEPR